MPWKERSIVEERMRFVLRLKDGESMASLCREFGISRVTGYKIYERYKECGLEGLTDRARTPYRYANKLPAQIEAMIVSLRREKPTWGARKLRERLLRKLPNDVRVPACSTIHAILDRHGLVTRQRRSRTKTEGTPLSQGLAPNALWCTDYKGEFMLGDKRYCYPLTVSDYASRKSISVPLSQVKLWVSKRSTTVSGWSALWTMISVISIWRRRPCNP